MKAVDLFAGPGGWDVALQTLGLNPLGIETDEAAYETRKAAGLMTIRADVSKLDPLDHAPCELLLGSPPCPTFSRAGKGDGIADMHLVYEAATAAARGKPVPPLPWRDERSALVVEPLRWAILLEPRFLAWEQVPDVLPFWEHCAELLRAKGWSVWCGKVEAERFGVPQTRERAILMADREGPVHPPKPTHQRYVKGEPQRHEVTMDGEILPWVSMAEALRWTPQGQSRHSGPGAEREPRPGDAPSYTIRANGSGSHPSGVSWVMEKSEDRPERKAQGAGNRPRSLSEPAATVDTRADLSKWVYDRRQRNGDGSPVPPVPPVPTSEPAPTLTAGGLAKSTHQWTLEQPSTNVNGDPRISQPGRHDPEESGSQQKDAIRITEEEALVLQSFPADYPLQGTKSQRFQQIGNAVPPLLAHAILSSLLAPVLEAAQDRSPDPLTTTAKETN